MNLRTTFLVTLPLLLACSARTDPSESAAQDSTSTRPAHDANDTFTSAVGNAIAVDFVPPGSSLPSVGACPSHKVELDVLYTDGTAFFGNADAIRVWSRTTDKSGQIKELTETARADSGSYAVTHCLDTSERPSTIELAFADAAGHTWDSDHARNYLVDLTKSPPAPAPDPTGDRDTAVGNHLHFDIVLHPASNANCASPVLDLVYEDRTRFFGGASTIDLFFKTTSRDGSEAHKTVVLESIAPGKYESVRLCMGWDAGSRSLAVAFSDAAGHKWDSNDAQNYVFTF